MDHKVKHLAIIMDGNARWAQKKSLNISQGHETGIKNIEPTIKYCIENDVEELTLYSFSTENFKRPEDEVNNLINAIENYIDNGADKLIKEYQPKIRLLGEKEGLKKSLLKKIAYIEGKTKNFTNIKLNIAFNYGGQQEIVSMTKKISKKVQNGKINIEEINLDVIRNNLYLPNISEPDLLIRTGGFFRVSNFLLWHIAYSELFFSKILWPDFGTKDLDAAFVDFMSRKRNYGGRK